MRTKILDFSIFIITLPVICLSFLVCFVLDKLFKKDQEWYGSDDGGSRPNGEFQ